MNDQIFSPISLKYIHKEYEETYQHHSKIYTSKIFKFFFLYMLLALLISLAKNIYIFHPLKIIRTLMLTLLFVFLAQAFKKFGEKRKIYLDIGFCFIIALIYIIHLKFFFPILFEHLSNRSIFYFAAGLESWRFFLFIAKINWMLVLITNMILNYAQYSWILESQAIEKANLFSFLFPLILSNTFPFVAFFMEKNFKLLFHQLISFDRTLKSFEELINKILPNQIIILDEQKREILFCNEEVHKFYETTFDHKIFNHIQKILLSENNLFEILAQIQQNEEKFNFLEYQTTIWSSKAKQDCYFDVKIGKIHWQNQNAFLILMSDITAAKLVKQLKELDEYKDRLLATVSHDLRTPLNGLVGILGLLLGRIFEKESKKYLKIAMRCSNLLLFMINDILDFSQIRNGKLRLIFSRYRVTDLIKEVTDLIKFQCQRKNLAFILDIPKDLINQMLCDHRRVQQVLLNLLSNALKFTSTGHLKLMVRKIVENGKRFIKFSVEDTGLGIKKEDLTKLFKLFGKLDGENLIINPSGVGLGLVISRHMLELLSGDPSAQIEIISEYEKGSTFSFKLPLNIPEEEEINEEFIDPDQRICDFFKSHGSNVPSLMSTKNLLTSPSISPTPDNSKIMILLVDDDQINLFVISKYLDSFGINYQTANNGKMALELILKNKNFTFIMMDCYMPIMDGFEAAQQIKDLAMQNIIPNIMILALTASTSNQDIDKCAQSGMDEYLAKPVSKKELKEKLQEMMHIVIFEKEKSLQWLKV